MKGSWFFFSKYIKRSIRTVSILETKKIKDKSLVDRLQWVSSDEDGWKSSVYSMIDNIKKMTEEDYEKLYGILNSSTKIYKAEGELIINEGDEYNNCVYVLLTGALEVKVKGILKGSILRSGEIFGEHSMLTERVRNATVETVRPSIILEIEDLKKEDHNLLCMLGMMIQSIFMKRYKQLVYSELM